MISIKNLTVQFSSKIVLNDISIDFTPNYIHGIVGLNGAGKTTFFNSLSTNLKVNRGELKFNTAALNYYDIAYLETNNFFTPNLPAMNI